MADENKPRIATSNAAKVQGVPAKAPLAAIPPAEDDFDGADNGNEDEGNDMPPMAGPATVAPMRDYNTRKKPGAKIINEYGELERRRRPMNLGLSDMVMPPVMRKQVAKYRILGGDKIDPSTKMPADPVDIMYPGTYMFNDIGETDLSIRNKLIKNVTRPIIVKDKVSGKDVIDDDQIEGIWFRKGILTIDIMAHYIQYVFMELHPLNATNKFRPRSIQPEFERIDIKTIAGPQYAMAAADLAFEAESEVRTMTDRDRIIGYATSMGITTTEGGKSRRLDHIRHDLGVVARSEPRKFFSVGGGDIRAAVKMNMIDAADWGIVEYDQDRRRWILASNEQALYTVMVQEDPMEGLVNFFASPAGQPIYETVMSLINYWNRD